MKKMLSLLLTTAILLSCLAVTAVSANAATKLSPGYYVVGAFNNWSLDRNYRMTQPESVERYVLSRKKLSEGDELKVVYSADGIHKDAWYPDSGPSTNVIVPEDGYYNVRFSINTGYSLSDWAWELYLEPCDPPTDVSDPTEPEPRNLTKELWERGASLTSEDIEEAANEQYGSRVYFFHDDITLYRSYRFNCTPAYIVDFGVKGYGIYCEVITEEYFGDYLFWSASSYEPSIFTDGKLYTLAQAYRLGVLTDEMLFELVEAEYRGGDDYGYPSCWIRRNIKGDADGSGDVDIVDATYIQRYEAQIIGEEDFCKPLADVDGNNDVNVIDATYIQRFEAGMSALDGTAL